MWVGRTGTLLRTPVEVLRPLGSDRWCPGTHSGGRRLALSSLEWRLPTFGPGSESPGGGEGFVSPYKSLIIQHIIGSMWRANLGPVCCLLSVRWVTFSASSQAALGGGSHPRLRAHPWSAEALLPPFLPRTKGSFVQPQSGAAYLSLGEPHKREQRPLPSKWPLRF